MDSIPIHIWTEYEVLKDGTIHTYTFTECFAQPDSMGNLPCNPGTDSSQRSFRIDPSGTFEALN
jgi:hypothetical protein